MSTDDENVGLPSEPTVPDGWSEGAYPSRLKRRILIILAVVAGLAVAAGVPVGLASLVPKFEQPSTQEARGNAGSLPIPVVEPTALSNSVLVSEASTQEVTQSPTSKRVSVSPSASGGGSFQSVSYEAEDEDNSLGGSARIVAYANASGGKLVRDVGKVSSSRWGWVQFNKVTVPRDGKYQLTFYTANVDGQATRDLWVVTALTSGQTKVSVTGGKSCCGANTIKVNLKKGINPITFLNPDGPAPSLDRIVVSS
jgi:hypothetical protein